MSHGNGAVRFISHDLDYRPTRIQTTGIQDLRYTYDKNDNIVGITNGINSSYSQNYSYDELNRLVEASGESFSYDGVGNRTSHSADGENMTYSYSSTSNQLEKTSMLTYDLGYPSMAERLFNYNENGHMEYDNGVELNYNAENRLVHYKAGSQNSYFSHNALGQRVTKSGPYGSYHYLYDEVGQLIAENSSGGSVQKEYIYLHGQVIGMIKANVLYYVHNDHLGRAERITNSSKTTVWSAYNKAFDRQVVSNSIGDYNLGFPGQYFDKETNLYYNYFRDYDPSTGRYIQSDPIGLAAGVNTYAYVRGNPVNFYDPFGLCDYPAITISAGGGVGFFSGEAGSIHVYNPSSGNVFNFTYTAGGLGLGTPVALGTFVEVGVISGLDSPYELSGWGIGVSGFAGAGPAYTGQISGPSGSNYGGYTSGGAGGGYGYGASISALVTYTSLESITSLAEAPDAIKDAFNGRGCGCND